MTLSIKPCRNADTNVQKPICCTPEKQQSSEAGTVNRPKPFTSPCHSRYAAHTTQLQEVLLVMQQTSKQYRLQ
jgi:hypothetical protein